MRKILIVEDEENFGSLLKNYMELSGYDVKWAKSGTEAYSIFMQNDFDLCVLDVMLPHLDGFELGEKMRLKKKVPFFYLTAKNQKEDLIKGYKIGAEDYLTKPFDTEVLLLKMKAILNRTGEERLEQKQTNYQIGKFQFESKNRLLKVESDIQKLSPKEALLLELLCRYEGKILPREVALVSIWKKNDYFTKRSMDVYVGKLRKLLASDPSIKIETFHQMGFQLNVQRADNLS